MDKDGSGILDLSDIKGVYNAKKHPKVISGEKTEDEVFEYVYKCVNDGLPDYQKHLGPESAD